jgi:hypothetical protein
MAIGHVSSFHSAMCASCLSSDRHAPIRVILLRLRHR